MASQIIVTQNRARHLESILRRYAKRNAAPALGIAAAYVSVYGVAFLKHLTRSSDIREVRIITDIGDGVTHPQALRVALEEEWQVRVVDDQDGTFHPKLFVGADGFNAEGLPLNAKMVMVGSGNLTRGGLVKNIECTFGRVSDAHIGAAATAFGQVWTLGQDLTDERLESYEDFFARRNKLRLLVDLLALGVTDEPIDQLHQQDLSQRPSPTAAERAVTTRAATAAWTGLESFTGEYRFQIEFPRNSGEVLGRILRALGLGPDVPVLCEDGQVRSMRYRFYDDNSMFRLNVPNDVPGVLEAREKHSGLALVETIDQEGAPVRLTILQHEGTIQETIARSVALGAWGKTSTRQYGWY